MGQELARASLEDPRVELVGVADQDDGKAGRDLGEIIGHGRIEFPIEKKLEALLSRTRPEVAVLCTSSNVDEVARQAMSCLAHGAHVVTTCEDLAAPDHLRSKSVDKLRKEAASRGLVVIATGVNPGFVMDRLPVLLSRATRNIRRIRVRRVVDAATRRAQLQTKIGVGMSLEAFEAAAANGQIGHAGLLSSLKLLGEGLGITFEGASETIRPLIAETRSASSVLGPLEPGMVRGVYQIARGFRAGYEFASLELTMALDEPNPGDTVDIVGEPPLRFQGECPGDASTIATVLSTIPQTPTLQPGLRNVLDLTLVQPEIHPVGGWVRDMTELPVPARVGRPASRSKAPGAKTTRPTRRPASKKPTSKKPTAKKPAPKKPAPKKSASKKAPRRAAR